MALPRPVGLHEASQADEDPDATPDQPAAPAAASSPAPSDPSPAVSPDPSAPTSSGAAPDKTKKGKKKMSTKEKSPKVPTKYESMSLEELNLLARKHLEDFAELAKAITVKEEAEKKAAESMADNLKVVSDFLRQASSVSSGSATPPSALPSAPAAPPELTALAVQLFNDGKSEDDVLVAVVNHFSNPDRASVKAAVEAGKKETGR